MKVVKKIHFSENELAMCCQHPQKDRTQLITTSEKSEVTCQKCIGYLEGKINIAHFKSFSELPATAFCLQCQTEKPIADIMTIFSRKRKLFRIRPRCKKCHNEKEKGNRREYKRNYLQNWRKNNPNLSKTYWESKEVLNERAKQRYAKNRDAMLIQVRMRRRGIYLMIDEARSILHEFGRNYMLPSGLSNEGKKECARIRSRLRNRTKNGHRMPKNWEIRLMVFEDAKENPSWICKEN